MITLSVDENNDLYLSKSKDLSVSLDLEALVQACTQATSALKGELAYNTQGGVDYPGLIWGVPDLMLFETDVINALLDLPGVNDVSNFLITRVDGQMTYSANVHTIYGDLTI